MRIAVLSDTHGSLSAVRKAVEGPLAGAERLLHAGDVLYHGPRNPMPEGYDTAGLADYLAVLPIPWSGCRGNCDAEVDNWVLERELSSPFLVYEEKGLTIVVVHGHGMTDRDLVSLAQRNGARVVVTGHTHVPRVEEVGGVVIINPGSPSLPKGQNPVASAGLITEGRAAVLDMSGRELMNHPF